MEIRKTTTFDTLKYIGSFIAGIFIPYISIPLIFYYGYKYSKTDKIKTRKKESKAIYVRDRRYKTGQRYDGHRDQYVVREYDANEAEIKYLRKKSKTYTIIGFSLLLIWSIILCCTFLSLRR